jgi:dienelactone hydrolase
MAAKNEALHIDALHPLVVPEIHGKTETNGGRFNVRAMYPRLLSFGVSYGDLEKIAKAATNWLSFSRSMADLARHWEVCGDRGWKSGRMETPRVYWRHAADYYHYAQLKLPDSCLKEDLRASSRRCYQKLVSLLDPPAARYTVPFKGSLLPGYLRVARPGAPCVILIGGLDSAKEVELHYFAETFLRRSCSVFYFDGPGQGEMSSEVSMTSGFENAVAAVIAALSLDARVGNAPIGCFGVAVGGHLACRAAASNARIEACVSLGGFFDSGVLPKLPPLAGAAFRKAYGLSLDDDFTEIAPHITLETLQGQMMAPLLLVHGTADHLVDMAQITQMQNWACGPVDLMLLDDSEHACADRFNECLPRIGDWMSNWLLRKNRPLMAI